MLKAALRLLTALLLTIASATVQREGDERAMYGHEGPLEQNWLPREQAGWPAAFLADSPNTSVPHKVGLEDDFRLGPFVATLSFWFLIASAVTGAFRRMRDRSGKRSRGGTKA